MDHQHDNMEGESEIHTNVSYNDGEVRVQLEDVYGAVPELEKNHEKEMHLIIVSNDLESFMHLHPKRVENGVNAASKELKGGSYQAFVDIVPKGQNYAPSAFLSASKDRTQDIDGKTVTLETDGLSTNGTTTLDFYLHGEEPEPYLGALGHVVILDEDAETFIHVHPTSDYKTTFETHFAHPGLYKVWAEFKYKDAGVLTFPFILQVDE